MKRERIRLYIQLSEILLRFRLSVFEGHDGVQTTENNEISETLGYQISGTGELSRMVEVILKRQQDSEKIVEKFHELSVCLEVHTPGVKKYSGYFLYTQKNNAFKIYKNELTLYLYIPELTFDRFCKEIASKNIHSLTIAIMLDGEQDISVGAFGPPDLHDIISITADDFMFDSNVKLDSIAANIQLNPSNETDKNDEF